MDGRDLLGDGAEAVVGLAQVGETLPVIEDGDFMPAPLPSADEQGAGRELWLLAGPDRVLAARSSARGGDMRVPDRGAQKATGIGVEPALGRGLKAPGEFAEEEGFEARGRRGGVGRLPEIFQIGESELCEGFEAGLGSHWLL